LNVHFIVGAYVLNDRCWLRKKPLYIAPSRFLS
jgi:hypothetical protein